MFEPGEFEAPRWLAWAVDRAHGWACNDAELVGRLGPDLAGAEREETLREIERRIAIWEPVRIAGLCDRLADLEQRNRSPGRAAQSIDRLLQRLLHRVEPARVLAETCLASNRGLRRRAAWRYLRRYGFGPDVAALLAEQLRRDAAPELVSLATRSADVLRRVPLGPLLARIEGFYWRGRVVETLLDSGLDGDVCTAAADWPGEAIFAIRRAGRRDLALLVSQLLDEHPDDLNVVTGAIQAFGIFGETEDMLRAATIGRQLLVEAEQRMLERFGVGREALSRTAG